jgi:alpha-ketoglutarate-dependent taurine dioxygenase
VAVANTHLTPRIGSEIAIDRETLLSGTASTEIRRLLEQRGVLIVRGLRLEDEQLLAAAQTLGDVRLGSAVAKEGVDGIKPVTFDQSANPATAQYFRGTFFWHMDGTYDDVPPLAALLVPRVLAPEGGETEFANTYAAYDDLGEADKRRFEGLTVEHTMAAAHRLYTPEPTAEQLAHWAKFPARSHPLVWRHRSGRKSLLLSSSVARVEGMDEAEGQALLAELMAWTTQPQYVYRHEWRMGDLLIWDNTGTMHRAMPFDLECGRRLHRVTLEGEESFSSSHREGAAA